MKTRLVRSVEELRGLRAARWTRESTAGQFDRYGPGAQRELQDGAIRRLGLIDTGLEWQVAESGASVHGSAAMAAMLRAAKGGAFDILVVAYVARWQRNLRQTLNLLEEDLHPAGVAVYFCDEDLLSSKERDWDQLVDEAKAAESWLRKHARRVREGYAAKLAARADPGGQPAVGFRRNAEKLLEADPATAPVVRTAFELAASGETDRVIARRLGLTLATVRGMFSNPAYVGQLRDGRSGHWQPLVGEELWVSARRVRAQRATTTGRPAAPRRAYALSMLRCGSCGHRIHGSGGYYRHDDACAGFRAGRPARGGRIGRFDGKGYRVAYYDAAIGAILDRVALGADLVEDVVGVVAAPAETSASALASIERRREAALALYRRDRDTVALDAAMKNLDREEHLLSEPHVTPGVPAAEARAYLADLGHAWRSLNGDPSDARRQLARALFARIEVVGLSEMRLVLTPEARAYGFADAIPSTFELDEPFLESIRPDTLNIRKKSAGIAFSATLLASLIAVIAAPFASASVSVTSAGNVPRNGTSATAATFTLRENSVNCFGNGAQTYGGAPTAGYISIQIKDSVGNNTVHFVPPVGLSAPGSLGATTTLQSIGGGTNNVLTVQMTGHDDLNIEQIVESAKISADSGAATGAIQAQIVAIPPAANPGATNQGPCVVTYPTTVTASGRLGNNTTPLFTSLTTNETGKATAATTTIVTNATGAYVAGQLTNCVITFTGGTAVPSSRTIASNTATTITVATPFTTAPTAGDSFVITPGDGVANTASTIQDCQAAYTVNSLAGHTLTMTSGPASGETRTIASNGTNSITVSTPFAPAPGIGGDSYTVSTASYPIGSSVFNIVLDAGSCDFKPTGGSNGNLNFTTNAENHAITVAPPSVAGLQNGVTTGTPTTNAHFPGENVTQTVANCNPLTFPFTIGSPGTVTNALTQTVEGTPTVVNIGENNQSTADTILSETPSATGGTITGTVTFTIMTPGVLFSASPTVSYDGTFVTGPSVCSISVDRKSCSVTVANSGTSATNPGTGSVEIENIRVDVDTTAIPGSPVVITAANGSTPVNVTSATVAFVGRVIIGVAAQPTIYIGFNDQQSGMKTLTEAGPGFFQSGISGNNTFGLCIITGETFTRAPWAVVTNAGGVGPAGLQILNPTTATGVSQIQGTLTNGGTCAYWTVFSGSTTGPATIEIRGSADGVTPLPSGANNGPRLSVPNGLAPGSEQAAILIGQNGPVVAGCDDIADCTSNAAFAGIVSEAIRAFKNSVTVAATGQPNCLPGTTDCLLGNIVITETQNGQLKPGDTIRGYFVPDSKSLRSSVFIKAGNTNDQPIIVTNSASGLLVSTVTIVCPPNLPLLNVCFFQFTVTQQAFGPTLGQVTISNIHASVAPDATPGPIQMDWGNTGLVLGVPIGAPNGQPFETVVSNGTIGPGPTPPGLTTTRAASAIGKTQNPAAFSVGTKVVHLVTGSNNIVTIRIKLDPAMVGKLVMIQVATKTGGVWSGFANAGIRRIDADGNAYYYASAHSAHWNSYRGVFAGDAQNAPSRSQTVQVRWVV